MLPPDLRQQLEEILSIEIERSVPVSGGDIHESFLISTSAGESFFVKMNSIEHAWEMLSTEAMGLKRLEATGTVTVPEIIECGKLGSYAFLVLEFIDPGNPIPGSWEEFAQNLGQMHGTGEFPFGLDHDNFIGRLHQRNRQHDTWAEFYRQERLLPQLEQMQRNFPRETAFFRDADALLPILDHLVEDAAPSLIHGDMWGGNYLVSRSGRIILIDPAVSVASREMDIAMSKLFGGYPREFYEAYQHDYPFHHGWEERIPLYQLYYLLVHVNLFGSSYINGAHRAIRKYL